MLKSLEKKGRAFTALVMACVMVFTLTVDLFTNVSGSIRALANDSATPTDAEESFDVTLYVDSETDGNFAGVVVGVYRDKSCTDSVGDVALSYDGAAYIDDKKPIVFSSFDEKAVNTTAEKFTLSLEEGKYFYRIEEKLYKSDDCIDSLGYEYTGDVFSFSVNSSCKISIDEDAFVSMDDSAEIIVFDHYYSEIDESLVETTDLIVTTSNESIFTKNTNVISNYDNAYIISCETVEEARYVYSYYVDKVDTISDLSKTISVATDESEDLADLSDLNNDTDALSTLNDIDTKSYKGYIALIDTGADADVNFSVIGDDTSDTNGHGTKMLNLIKENNPDAKVMSIKVSEGSKTDAASIYAGIMLAIESKVSVINLSMVGYDTESNAIVKEAIEEAIASGITVIGAAGNYNLSAKKFIPGSISGVIVVGAANEDGTKYSKSNYDADVYVVATSTSEAAAIYTGLYTAEKLDDERIYTSLVTETADEEDDEDTTETEVSEEAEKIALNTVNSVKELLENSGDDSFELEYEINDDGSVSITYVSTDFETAMDTTASGLIKDCGTVSYDLFTTTTTGTTVETGTCTIAYNKNGISTASNFSGSGMFSDILDAAGVSSIGVCCERHWENETDSAHATTLYGSGIKYKAVLTSYTTSDGKAKATIDLYFTNDNYSDRSWTAHSAAFAWSISMSEITGTSTYTVAASVSYNGSSIYSYTGTTNGSEIDNMVTVVQGEIDSAMSEVSKAAADDYGGVRWDDPMTKGTSPYYSWNSTAASTVTYYWHSTGQDQIYRGRITATAPMNIKLTLTKAIDDDYSSFTTYCNSYPALKNYYSLVGTKIAVYTEYTSSKKTPLYDVNGDPVVLTISSESDLSDTFTISASNKNKTVYIVEESCGTGYQLDTTVYKYTLPDAGGSGEYTVENTPMYDPLQWNLIKVSDTTGKSTSWSGETSSTSATYTITGYSLGSGNTKDKKFATWEAKTDSNGLIDFMDPDYYTSGTVYTDSNGDVQFPIGYYTIEETAVEESSGIEVSNKTYTFIVYPSSDKTGVDRVLKDGSTVIFQYTWEDGKYTSYRNSAYKITLADGSTALGTDTSGNFYTVETEVWAKLGLFKTDEAYISSGYKSTNSVLKASNAGTSFAGAVFNIYVDASEVSGFSASSFFPASYDNYCYMNGGKLFSKHRTISGKFQQKITIYYIQRYILLHLPHFF